MAADRGAPAPHVPTSAILARLVEQAPTGTITFGWLFEQLQPRSFGIILLLLGVMGMAPLVSPLAAALIAVPALQMIRAHAGPVFPRRLAARAIPVERLRAVLARVIPALGFLERFVRPRWPTPFQATKRIVGAIVLLLGLGLLAPIPLSNVLIGLVIVAIAFAYLEEDGLLLALSLAAALCLFAAVVAALWGSVDLAVGILG